jgi:hypothetical protein
VVGRTCSLCEEKYYWVDTKNRSLGNLSSDGAAVLN